jgi:hypothetical protein
VVVLFSESTTTSCVGIPGAFGSTVLGTVYQGLFFTPLMKVTIGTRLASQRRAAIYAPLRGQKILEQPGDSRLTLRREWPIEKCEAKYTGGCSTTFLLGCLIVRGAV